MKPLRTLLPLILLTLLIACTLPTPAAPPPSPEALPSPTASPIPPTPVDTPTPEATITLPATPTPEFIPYTTPDWFKNAILYEIFVRSFADSDGNGTGDFNGIAAQLDYIASLGTDVIWLMPIHPSPSDHGYDVTDFLAVNPDYGTLADFQHFVDEAHARDIRILIDFVSSHLSNQNPIFKDAFNHPESEYDEWFHFTNDANTSYQAFADLSSLPRFNHFNPEVVDYLEDAALFWMDLDGDGDYTDGVDGFRVDNATFPPKEFFVDLRQTIKRANPEALLLGEVWVERVSDLTLYYPDQFDALFNFPFYTLLASSSKVDSSGQVIWELPPSLLTRRLNEQDAKYPPESILVQFASNHDTDRLGSVFNGDVAWQRLMAAVTVILPESIALYYGEEIGMLGVKGGAPYWDNYRREPMDWYAAEAGPLHATWFTVPDRWNSPNDAISVEEQEGDPGSLLNTYRHLLTLRQTIPALHNGDFVTLIAAAIGRKAWVVQRTAGDQILVGIYNFGNEESAITVDAFPFTSAALIDLISGDAYPGSVAGTPYVITLPPAGVVWFVIGG